MGTYYVETTDSIVDGSIFCGGFACTQADTIIIRGGARGSLLFKDFDGSGSYITITNEDINPDAQVVITGDGAGGTWSPLELRDCKYIDLRGDNDADLTYGIKVIYDNDPIQSAAVWVRQECDHIKLSYIEIDHIVSVSSGIMVHDCTLSDDWIFDTVEIHHNYIHGTGYAGMYLGHNLPSVELDPYCANFSVHHNLLEDLGAYGITLKGVHSTSGVCLIYNNIIRPSNRGSGGGNSTGLIYASDGSAWQGIGVQYFYGTTYANIYNNWIEKTKGSGLKIGDQNHQVYNNTICGCGSGDGADWGHGIVSYNNSDGVNIYDNIIIQSKRYGIYALSGAELDGTTLSRNLIGDAGIGEWSEEVSGRIIESIGEDANVYYADVASFGFDAWSDDGDYSNDEFTFSNTTVAPTTTLTTTAPTTLGPTTVGPTTIAPTTIASTTLAPTSLAPTSLAPTTVPSTTFTTAVPTTSEPTTIVPTTLAPTTIAPTTITPTTGVPTTPAPLTTGRLFIDSFDSGGLYAWEEVALGASIVSTAGLDMEGTYCAHLSFGSGYVKEVFSDHLDTIFCAFYYRPLNDDSTVLGVFSLSNDSGVTIFRVELRNKILRAYIGPDYLIPIIKLGTGTINLEKNTTYHIEIKFVADDNPDGRIEIKVDGVTDILWEGGTVWTGNYTFRRVKLGFDHYSHGNSYINNVVMDKDDWIGVTKIVVLTPIGVGNLSDWTPSAGNNWDCVDEVPPVEADHVYTDSIDITDTYEIENAPHDISEIKSIQVQSGIDYTGTPTPTGIQAVMRIGGTDYLGVNTSIDSNDAKCLWENNPDDSAIWEETDINNLEIGVKSKTYVT